MLLLLLVPLKDTRPDRAQQAYDHAYGNFARGNLIRSQSEATWGQEQFQVADPGWAARFQLLRAENTLWQGFYSEAQQLVESYHPDPNNPDENIRAIFLEALAIGFKGDYSSANQRLAQADALCQRGDFPSCGNVLKAHGNLAMGQGQMEVARSYALQAYAFAQKHRDRLLEGKAAGNLSITAYRTGRYDLAQEWSQTAYRDAVALGNEDLEQISKGNYALACFPFGDTEKSRELFLQAAKTAARLGNLRYEFVWLNAVGDLDLFAFKYTEALPSYQRALELAREIGDKGNIANELLNLANIALSTGKLNEAAGLLDQADAQMGKGSEDPKLMYLRAELARKRGQDGKAEELYRKVETNPNSLISWRFDSSFGIATILESEGRVKEAETEYKTSLAKFESKRSKMKDVASRLPFLTAGYPIFTGYIHLLIKQGRAEEALELADQSRGRTLTERLGESSEESGSLRGGMRPQAVARKTGATLLYYWLGREQSYLWVVTPQKITAFQLPTELEIANRVVSYRKALLEMQDPVANGNEDGRALYSILVAPAARLLHPNEKVILLDDGELSKLNFEALPVPGKASGQPTTSGSHYWIEDVTLRTAPSMAALAGEKPAKKGSGRLLLMGDAKAASPDYPDLPMAAMEMNLIRKHFTPATATVFTHAQATPAAYLTSAPERYSYIHFVTHGVASSIDPLDSSIILSRPAAEESFKLYARDILQHPVDAQLVTISACYGSGTRSYGGEGLVGLSWAFLRAGAHHVIGTLWEVSDESTPRLMDGLYQGLQQGETPDVALRQAKLNLLHTSGSFHVPFFWAPFQVYSRH